jgi:dienelactone hydrolase
MEIMDDPSPFDTGSYRRARIEAAQPEFSATVVAEALADGADRARFQADFRARFAGLLGGPEGDAPDLDAVTLESRQMDGYRREAVSFATLPGLRAFGYFLVPDGCAAGQPAMLCLPGHGRGVDTIVGIAEDGSQRALGRPEEYAADYALQCVARGYPTLALDMIGFGVRRDKSTRDGSAGASTCARDSVAALMLGETVGGWRVREAARAIDYLESRCEFVDPERIGVLGCSGGGMAALFTAACDERVRATVVSAYFNTFAASILGVDHCVCNFVPGLLELCEMPELAALVAPRALFVESGTTDPIFPRPAFDRAVERARRIYADFGAPGQFGSALYEGGHGFYGADAFAFLERVFVA